MRHDSVRPVTTDLADVGHAKAKLLVVERLPHLRSDRLALLSKVALASGLSQSAVEHALRTLPAAFELPPRMALDTTRWVASLSEFGGVVRLEPSGHTERRRRDRDAEGCARCRARGASQRTLGTHTDRYCGRCQAWQRVRRAFFLTRVSVLLTVLLLVSAWGYADAQSRAARTHWDRTLSVALVLATKSPIDPESIQLLEARLSTLESRLAKEKARYRTGPQPFRFTLVGPTSATAPPKPPENPNLAELALHSVKTWWYLFSIDHSLGLRTSSYDSRIYVVAEPPTNESFQLVEGYGEYGGRVGIVEVELNHDMVDVALAVAVHELMHTLGARDKYDETGDASVPLGLAEPDRVPMFPQDYVEVMARNRPLTPTSFVNLDSLDELKVGPTTAYEIGWLDALPHRRGPGAALAQHQTDSNGPFAPNVAPGCH